MPRRARVAIPHLPHHLLQRGHCREAVFFSDADRIDYLGTLAECRVLFDIRVYAYCLMDNHVHLLVDPLDDATRLSALMKRLAGRHSRRLNAARGWSGSLWEGRFKCSPIDTERYLLACGRYIDQNPVRARMVARPSDYRWSSYRARAGLVHSPFLDPDPALQALSPHLDKQHEIYRSIASATLTDEELQRIRGACQRNQLTGEDDFIDRIRNEQDLDVPARKPGRPRKAVTPGDLFPAKEKAPLGALSSKDRK
jgi:putative transposase